MPAFRLAHLSDLHLAAPALAAQADTLALKQRLSQFAWRRKQARHSEAALAAIVADVQAQAPDHIAVTGDLTNFSTAAEFAAARAWLQRLAAPDAVTVSPGNHDALAGKAGPERFDAWRPWLGDEGSADFPQVRRRGPVALVNMCSSAPTALHLAQGVLGPGQIERLRAVLRALGREGLCRVLLIHHPPAAGIVSRRKALRDAPALLAVLEQEGAELVLHGHAHAAVIAAIPGPDTAIAVLGAPSASASGGAARWHCISIARDCRGWAIEVAARGIGAGGAVEDLGAYTLAHAKDSAPAL